MGAYPFDGVSAILPAYCREWTAGWCEAFDRAAASVLSQAVDLPLELLVIDDGSIAPIPSHPRLAALFKDPRVTCVRLERNHGLVFALNTGLNLARHGLIARIDCDDAWRPGKLAKQMALFMADPDLTITATGMRLVHANRAGKDQDLVRPGSWAGILDFTVRVGCPFPHGSILARRDLYHLLGGYAHDPRTAHCEDFALWAIWLRFFKPAMVEAVLYDYTVSDSAVSAVYADRQRQASDRLRAAFLKLPRALLPDILMRISRRLGLSLLNTGKACYTAWRFYDGILADPDLVDDLTLLLPDRRVMTVADAMRLPGGRFFRFSRNPPCESSPGRPVHGPWIVDLLA